MCQESINQPSLRNAIQAMQHDSLQHILRYVSNQQRYKLKHELSKMGQHER